MIAEKYMDLHTHTLASDGIKSNTELIEVANENNINILAITDHDYLMSYEEFSNLQKEAGESILLIRGTEVNCTFIASNGEKICTHIVVLFPNKESDTTFFQKNILSKNKDYDRRLYIENVLSKIKEVLNISITYQELEKRFGHYIGRPQIAIHLSEILGTTPDQILDEYIGSRGLKKAYVSNPYKGNFVSMTEIIDEAKRAKAIPILAHPLLYSPKFQLEIIEAFHTIAGDIGGIEYFYARYDDNERKIIDKYLTIAGWKNPILSVGSDYHGIFLADDIAKNKIPSSHYINHILPRWIEFYGENH